MNFASAIGVFDSGVGGLTVLKALASLLPHENMLYLGDTARVPYGTRSQDTIARYALTAAGKLVDMGVKALVIACNTATAAALPLAAARFAPIPVIGVIEPGARAAAMATRNGHIAVLATEATINGGAYQRAIAKIAPGSVVVGRACTLLVPLAEEGWLDGPITEGVIEKYLSDIFDGDPASRPDTLLLGCTHFPLFRSTLKKMIGPGTSIVDSASATAEAVRERLAVAGLVNPSSRPGATEFFTTDHKIRFARTGSLFLERDLDPSEVELLDL